MTEAERLALVEVVRVIRSAGSEESAVDALRDAITDAMAVAIERYGTGASFDRSRGNASAVKLSEQQREKIAKSMARLSDAAFEASREA